MSNRYIGGVITEKVNVAQSPWSGEWTEQAQLQAKAQGTWAPLNAQIGNSLRFRSSASAYLNRTPSVNGNRLTWTLSVWFKLGAAVTAGGVIAEAGSTDGSYYTGIRINSSNQFYFLDSPGGGNPCLATSAMVLRDPSSWYHLVVSVDTTQANGANRVRFFINGSQITMNFTATYPQNSITSWNSASLLNALAKSARNDAYQVFTDIYLAEVNFIDGQALTPAAFGIFDANTGVWKPTVYGGTYGTNGFHLPFSNGTSTTTLGYDSSGNSNNWTCNNISLTAGSTYDWMLDSPTPLVGTSYGVGNYAVLNPLDSASTTLISGNLAISQSTAWATGLSTIKMTSGKWYFEVRCGVTTPGSSACAVGIANQNYAVSGNLTGSNSCGYYSNDGTVYNNGSAVTVLGTYTNGDVIGVAFDVDSGKIWFRKNGTWLASGNPDTGANPVVSGLSASSWTFGVASYSNTNNATFGQRPFLDTPPSGFKSLCTYNLPAPAIANGANYMAATTYTGLGVAQAINNTVNGVYFQPDFVWTKARSGTVSTGNHMLGDIVRGTNNTLFSNNTLAAYTDRGVDSFNSNGFTYSTSEQSDGNASGTTYIAWQWKAGGTAVTNTNGSITSQVSASALSGFSVVTYTGTGSAATVGHGLGVAPSMVIVKRRNATQYWAVWHTSLSSYAYELYLNTTDAQALDNSYTAAPSSTVLSLATGPINNASGGTYVAYCFAAIAGYSAFGSYTGNGSADGPFVYCGFRPRFVMVKMSSGVEVWAILDTARDTYNVAYKRLLPNSSSAENTGDANVMDILSNGFKLRSTDTTSNGNGSTYIYAAFAENPFQNALAR